MPRLRSLLPAQPAQCLVRDRHRGFCRESAGRHFEQDLGERTDAARADQFEMTEPGPAEDLRPRRIGGKGVSESGAHPFPRAAIVEADKIDDDAAAETAQSKL